VLASAPLPNSRPSATRSPSNPSPPDGGFSFQDEVPGSSPGRPTTHHPRSERCRQRAGNARRQPGPRWGRTPTPPARPSALPGLVHPDLRLHDHHAPWSRTAQDGSHASGAATSRCSSALCPQRSRQPRALRTPVWPAWSGSRQARPPPPSPNPAGSAADTPPTNARPGSVARVQASAVDRAARRRGSHRDLDPFPWCRLPRRPIWSPPPPPEVGGDGRVRTDGADTRGLDAGQWTPHGRTLDGWTPDGRTAGPRTTNPGGRTPDGLDTRRLDSRARTTEPGWVDTHAGRDRRPTPWLHPGIADHCKDARPLAAGWLEAPPGSRRLGEPLPGQLSSKDHAERPRHGRDRQLQVILRRPAAPRRTASSDDFGSSVERAAHGQVLWRAHLRADAVVFSVWCW
jgi:hypothetical protein